MVSHASYSESIRPLYFTVVFLSKDFFEDCYLTFLTLSHVISL